MQSDTDIEFSRALLPAVIARNEKIVRHGFWKKLLKKAGRVPFAEELATAYYCIADPATPPRVRGILLAALAYFVVPIDAIPDFVAGIGFTDDATVVAGAIALVSRHIRPEHRASARKSVASAPARRLSVRAGDIEKFCLSLPGATVVEQWGGCHVFKVSGKMFAILGPKNDHILQGLSLKVGEDSFHILIRENNIVPAPYLARAKWVSLQRLDALGGKELKAYLTRAHAIIASGLTKKKQAALGMLNQTLNGPRRASP